MAFLRRNSETNKLRAVTDALPRRVADWTPEQRAQQAAQSNRAAREQADASKPRKRGRR